MPRWWVQARSQDGSDKAQHLIPLIFDQRFSDRAVGQQGVPLLSVMMAGLESAELLPAKTQSSQVSFLA
jgi:hypothetical protein